MSKFTWESGLLRLFFAFVLVFSTYNPSEYSYFHWLKKAYDQPDKTGVLMIFAGVVLLIVWVIYLRATLRSLGSIGLVLACAFFGTLLWVIVDYGLVPVDNVVVVTWLVLTAFSGVLAVGVSWSHVRRRISGQADMDDLDEG